MLIRQTHAGECSVVFCVSIPNACLAFSCSRKKPSLCLLSYLRLTTTQFSLALGEHYTLKITKRCQHDIFFNNTSISISIYVMLIIAFKFRLKMIYTRKNAQLVHGWWEQTWTMFCCTHCSWLLTILNNIVKPESGVTILFNIVNSQEQCGQQIIVQVCSHQSWTTWCVFGCVY